MVNYKGYLIGYKKKAGYFIKCKNFKGQCIPFVSYEDCKDIVNDLINKSTNERSWCKMLMK